MKKTNTVYIYNAQTCLTLTHARTARTHTRTHARTHARTHVRTHARTHAHTHTLARPHARTHTQSSCSLSHISLQPLLTVGAEVQKILKGHLLDLRCKPISPLEKIARSFDTGLGFIGVILSIFVCYTKWVTFPPAYQQDTPHPPPQKKIYKKIHPSGKCVASPG